MPLPTATSFEDLNRQVLELCLQEDARTVARETQTIGEAWEQERSHFLPLPSSDYDCCDMVTVRLTPYSQAHYETNRYSVPVKHARRTVTVKAYPFTIDIFDGAQKLASHPRCYEHEQDVFDPLHYLALLEQKPGAFDYAKPLKRWRADWPFAYHRMLNKLKETWPDGRGVQEFVRILMLHERYPTEQMEQAIERALSYGCAHLDGVLYHILTQRIVNKSWHLHVAASTSCLDKLRGNMISPYRPKEEGEVLHNKLDQDPGYVLLHSPFAEREVSNTFADC